MAVFWPRLGKIVRTGFHMTQGGRAPRGLLKRIKPPAPLVRFAPPLTVEKKDLEWALTQIREVLAMDFGKKPALAAAH